MAAVAADNATDSGSVKKEAAVLTNTSMTILARSMPVHNLLKLCMLLNVPTVTLAKMAIQASEIQQSDADLCASMLLYWKDMRAGAKDKDKVQELERCLRHLGQEEIADVVVDRHKDQMEITSDALPK